jgi:hypothetical protein
MNTDIRYLELLDQDLQQAAARESLSASAPMRRSRVNWGTFAAAIVPILVVAGLIGWLATGGVGGRAKSGSRAADQPAMASPNSLPERDLFGPVRDQSAGGNYASTYPGPGTVAGAGGTGPVQTTDVSKIIRDGTISIRVENDDFSKGFASVTRIAENNGGFVLSSQTRGQRAGTLTLRIPAKRFDDAMLSLRAIGTVQAASVTGNDVTAQFIDLQARLRIAKERRTVLLGLQSQATTIGEVLTVQRQLDQVQLQIEQLQGQLNFIGDQVAEATIRVDLHERDAPTTASPNRIENPSLGSAWDRAVQGFLNVVSAVVIGLGYLIPIGVLALVVLLITLAVRRRRAAS